MKSKRENKVCVNIRNLQSPLTGVQRYTKEILARLEGNMEIISPSFRLNGILGHGWEQLVLPYRLQGSLLFSPSNTGPMAVGRQVVTIHDVVPLDHPEWLNRKFAAWYQYLIPRLTKRVEHVITISDYSKQQLLDYVPIREDRITVIPNGVNSSFYPRSENEITRLISKLKLPSRHYVLCVGSLEPRKNLSRLLKAWAKIQNVIPEEIWLVLTGKRGSAHVFARDAGLENIPPRVYLSGFVPDEVLPVLFSGALVFVFPSMYEGFGLPPLEAMAAGVPVLTGDRTSLPEVVGDAGIMVDPYDEEAIADGIGRLLADSNMRKELRRKGIERAGNFSWDETTKKTWKVLRRAAEK